MAPAHATERGQVELGHLLSQSTALATYAAAAFAARDYEGVLKITEPAVDLLANASAEHPDDSVPFDGERAVLMVYSGLARVALGDAEGAREAVDAAAALLASMSEQVSTFTAGKACPDGNILPFGICRYPPCPIP